MHWYSEQSTKTILNSLCLCKAKLRVQCDEIVAALYTSTLLYITKSDCGTLKFNLITLCILELTRCFAFLYLFHFFKRLITCLEYFANEFLIIFQLICLYSNKTFQIILIIWRLLYTSFYKYRFVSFNPNSLKAKAS